MKIIEIRGKRVCLVELYPQKESGDNSIKIGCGVYKNLNGQEKWTGECFDGVIPLQTLLEWGLKEGYLKFYNYSKKED
jgi:hypothetical protein